MELTDAQKKLPEELKKLLGAAKKGCGETVGWTATRSDKESEMDL